MEMIRKHMTMLSLLKALTTNTIITPILVKSATIKLNLCLIFSSHIPVKKVDVMSGMFVNGDLRGNCREARFGKNMTLCVFSLWESHQSLDTS